jgi:carboxymethylenebutenolidase
VAASGPSGDDAGVTHIALPYYSARPAHDDPGPGLVVIHEGNGMSPQLLRFCERMAHEGYAVVAPDLFYRAGGPEAADFGTLIGSLDPVATQDDLNAMAALLRQSGATSVGVTGFCMGGLWSYRCARSGQGFDAAVGFYGGGISKELGPPACPTLLLFGGSDEWIPSADIDAVAAYFPDTVVYPEAGHGFMRDGSENYHAESAADAWGRLLAFFGEHLH